jgi:hypothetical protein
LILGTAILKEGVFAMRIAQRVFSVWFLLVLVSIFVTETSFAATHVFKPEDHSVYLDQRDPDINKSDKTGILTASTLNENSRIVIHFDFGGWAPDPASITQAKLHLYHYRGGSYTGTRTLNVYSLTTGFDETTATWNSPWAAPGGDYDNSPYSFADVPEAWNNWVEWDVTDILKNQLGNVMSFGFLIRDPMEDDTGDGPYVRFRSHRYASEYPQEVPYLEIITTGQEVPTLTEWGMIVFIGLLLGFITWMFLRRRPALSASA